MDRYEADDPELLDTFTADGQGRINLGQRFGGKEVKVCVVEIVDD